MEEQRWNPGFGVASRQRVFNTPAAVNAGRQDDRSANPFVILSSHDDGLFAE